MENGNKKGILICGHGSRDTEATDAFKEMVDKIQERHKDTPVDYGFLEFAKPTFDVAVKNLYDQGVRDIISLPGIIFPGGHAKNDMPYEMNTLQNQYEDLRIRFGTFVGVSPNILKLSQRLIEEAEERHGHYDRKDTCLLVVGRGTSDPDGNASVAKLTRFLWEGMGFGFATNAFIGVTQPLLKDALPVIDHLPYKRVIAIPFFLFTGVLLKKIYAQLDEFNEQTEKEIVKVDNFGSDELILEAFDERIQEVEEGSPNMNCQVCKYRKQIVGFEDEVGKEQVGHHFHVRGSGQGDGHHHHHDHDHSH
ncbi:MAG: sirohydrochlorin chelatase [Flavobacteriales bacterium]